MVSLIVGLGFILLGILPYGFLNLWLLKDCENIDNLQHQISSGKQTENN